MLLEYQTTKVQKILITIENILSFVKFMIVAKDMQVLYYREVCCLLGENLFIGSQQHLTLKQSNLCCTS